MNRTSLDELAGGMGGGAVAPIGGAIVGQFEQMATTLAAQAKAQVEARYVIALRRPRNWDDVRTRILMECKRPSFANDKSAFYRKPVGDGIEGLGIRFVEMALMKMGNVDTSCITVYEDEQRETIRVTTSDLESNTTWSIDVRVSKSVERSKPLDDGTFISKRKNSYDKWVYTIPATDEDLLNKRGALISKAARTLGQRIIPGDIQAEAEDTIKATRLDTAAKAPDEERRKIVDGFAELGVPAVALVEFLGHSLDNCSPAELVELRAYWGALDAGDTTWQSIFEQGEQRRQKQAEGAKAAQEKADRKIAADKAKADAEAARKNPPAPKPATPPKPGQAEPATPQRADPEPGKPAPQAQAPTAEPTREPAPFTAPGQAYTPPPANSPVEGVTTGVQQPLLDQNAPTIQEALRAVNAGDDSVAQDIARSLGEDAQRKVSQAIAERDGNAGNSYE